MSAGSTGVMSDERLRLAPTRIVWSVVEPVTAGQLALAPGDTSGTTLPGEETFLTENAAAGETADTTRSVPSGEEGNTSALDEIRAHLRRIEANVQPEIAFARATESRLEAAGRRATQGEHRLPVAGIIGLAIVLQLRLPASLVIHPRWLFPSIEGALMIALTVANPVRINRTSASLRAASVSLIALISLANAWSSAELIRGLIDGTGGDNNASLLLARGASVYATNVIVFALWYWEWDRGGPVPRTSGTGRFPDFLFPQMTQTGIAPESWRPNFLDYFYVSFTNATAFSPTDTMPLTRWAKMLMLVQSSVALLTVAFVVARAVNVLK
jgi:hypothetical protein